MKSLTVTRLIWKDLNISPNELRLKTLKCGQSFRWKNVNDQWVSILQGQLVILKETPSTILYGHKDDENEEKVEKEIIKIRDYFQLDRVSLTECYARWSKIDPNFAEKALLTQGIRMLRQDPWENLISFICSSNNNITRISQMIDKMCLRFGTKVAELDGHEYYDFPTLDQLLSEQADAKKTETILRDLGFGYRANYIAKTAEKIKIEHGDSSWLNSLRLASYEDAKLALMELKGVGPKVADCICLMSLDHSETIPVDTHVWQIAQKNYGFNRKGKSLTTKLYVEVGDHFRQLFGEYSGWAHSVLFTAELKIKK